MVKIKALLSKMLNLTRNFLITRQQTVSIGKTFGARKEITAPTVDGYTFVCWLQPATSGWNGSIYVQNPQATLTNIWNATASTSGSGDVVITALYKANS